MKLAAGAQHGVHKIFVPFPVIDQQRQVRDISIWAGQLHLQGYLCASN